MKAGLMSHTMSKNHWNDIIVTLEGITNCVFTDRGRLVRALTHASIQGGNGNYERLEFLGDRVLGLLVAEMLCRLFPAASEGELSVRLNALVNAQTCAAIAWEVGLPDMIHMGAEMKMLDPRRLTNMYADVVEALIAVLYLEGGLETARAFIEKFWTCRAQAETGSSRDAKTQLQEWAHQQNGAQPCYRVVGRKGPDHDPIFEVEVVISGFAPARGKGSSKRHAERMAALALLVREGVREEPQKILLESGAAR